VYENLDYYHLVLELAGGITLFELVERNGHLLETLARSFFQQVFG
jgi:hypothetical protein